MICRLSNILHSLCGRGVGLVLRSDHPHSPEQPLDGVIRLRPLTKSLYILSLQHLALQHQRRIYTAISVSLTPESTRYSFHRHP
jgi:hypothetical protein